MPTSLLQLLPVTAAADFGVRVIEAILIAIATLLIASLVRARLTRLLLRARADVGLIALLNNMAYVAVIVFGTVIIASLVLGTASLTAFAAIAGASGLALSLATQDILRNFVAGVYLLLERPFRIGDQVSLRGIDGTVETIQVRTTVLKTATGLQVIVPNAIVFTEVVTNRSAYDLQRGAVRVEVGSQEFEEVGTRLLDILGTVAGLAEQPTPTAKIESITDETTTVLVEFWMAPGQAVVPQVVLAIRRALPRAKVAVV